MNNLYRNIIAGTFSLLVSQTGFAAYTGCVDKYVNEGETEEVKNELWKCTYEYQDRDRDIFVNIPTNPVSPLPVVVLLHGSDYDNGKSITRYSYMKELSDQHGFLLLAPNAERNGVFTLKRHWNDGRTNEEFAAVSDVDDIGFIKNMIDDAGEHITLDRNRVYVMGMSNGGVMGMTLACETSYFAGFGAVASSMYQGQCSNGAIAPIAGIFVFGNDDDIMPQQTGDSVGKAGAGMTIGETTQFWADENGCTSWENNFLDNHEIDYFGEIRDIITSTSINDFKWFESTSVAVTTSDNNDCLTGLHGQKAKVALYHIDNGGHAWPERDDQRSLRKSKEMDASATILKFFGLK